MALVVKDRVKDTTTTTGTGTITLANSPPNGYQAFSSLGDGSTTYYAIEDADKTDWEVGIGTYTLSGHTLARTTVLASTNSNNAISLSSGEHTVFCDYPSGKAFLSDEGIDKTFTASGTVTAGKPMQLKTDGTAEQIFKDVTTTNYDPQDATSEHTITGSDHWYTSGVEYNSTAGVLLFAHSNNSTYYPMITPATANADGTLNMGTPTVIESTGSYGGKVTSNTQANEFLYTWTWEGNTQGVRMKAGTIGGTSTAPTVTLGSMVQQDDRYCYYANTCYDSNVDRYCTTLYQSNSNSQTKGEVYAYTTSVSGTTPTVQNANGTRIFTSYDGTGGYNSNMILCAFDASANRVLVKVNGVTSDGGSTFKVMLQTIEVTTTGISGASNTPVHLDSTLSSSSGHAQSENTGCLKYDPDGERMLVGYSLRGASDALTRGKLKLANVSSTSCALGAETTVGSDPCKILAFGYDENIDKFGIYISSGSFGTTCDFYNMTYDGSDNITLSSKVVVNGSYGYRINNNTGTIMPYVPTVFAMYSAITNSTTTFLYSFQSKQVVTTINFDADRYLGVASTSATNGNEVQVNMPNKSINVDQTGLTIGEEYFTDNEGNVRPFYSGGASLTTGEYLGTAVSATDLQLKETPTELIGNSGASITKGDPVVVKTNGDYIPAANTVVESSNSGSASSGSTGVIDAYVNDLFSMAVASDGTTYAFCYREQSGQANVIVGTRSGESITWGSPSILASANSLSHVVVYNPDQDVFVCLYDNQTTHKFFARAISYSGTTITMGSEVELLASAWSSGGINNTITGVYDSNSKNVVAFFQGANNALGKKMTAVVLTASGTTLTAGSENANTTDGGQYIRGCDILNGKLLLYYRDGTQYYPNVIIATVDGNTVTWGSPTVIASVNYGSFCSPVYNPNYTNKAILIGKITTPNNYISYASLAISGTTITASNFSDGNINSAASYVETAGQVAVYSDFTGQYCVTYQDYSSGGNYYNAYRFMTTTNGETLTVGSQTTRTGDGTTQFYAGVTANDVNKYYVENNRDSNNTTYVYYVFNPTFSYTQTSTTVNLTAENYIGIAKSSSSAANKTAIITVDGGVDSNQSELTAGQLYYVQTDGTISTTAGSPSVVAGIGLSATELLVTKS